jgi:gamma-glutamylputrescine oxidase
MLLQKELGVIENSLYEASVPRAPALAPLAGQVAADVCVIGGGYAGLSAALGLAERGYSVLPLEAQRLGWGASGRNGGQVLAGFGAEGEHAILRQLSRADARRAWDASVLGLELVQQRIAHYRIDCDYTPGALTLAVKPRKMPTLDAWARHVVEQYDYPLRWIAPAEMPDWIASQRYHAGIVDERAGHLHPLKYCLGVAAAAQRAGVTIYEDSPVFRLEREAQPVAKTAQGQVKRAS